MFVPHFLSVVVITILSKAGLGLEGKAGNLETRGIPKDKLQGRVRLVVGVASLDCALWRLDCRTDARDAYSVFAVRH